MPPICFTTPPEDLDDPLAPELDEMPFRLVDLLKRNGSAPPEAILTWALKPDPAPTPSPEGPRPCEPAGDPLYVYGVPQRQTPPPGRPAALASIPPYPDRWRHPCGRAHTPRDGVDREPGG